MKDNIYDNIEVLIYKNTIDTSFPSIDKINFFNASISLSGNYIIFNTHDKYNNKNYESTPYHLDKIKGYRTQ